MSKCYEHQLHQNWRLFIAELKNKKELYTELPMKDKLNEYLQGIETTLMVMGKKSIRELAEKGNINKDLKSSNQML